MPDLFAKTALAGRAPVTLGGTTLAETDLGQITAIACFPGRLAEVTERLGGFPAPNRFLGAPLRLWTGPEQAFLIGAAAPDLAGLAAVTDQSGGWAALTLDGPEAEAALARLFPIDLRSGAFPVGSSIRAPLGHMQSALARMSETRFLILVLRSMARSAWSEVAEALERLAARAAVAE